MTLRERCKRAAAKIQPTTAMQQMDIADAIEALVRAERRAFAERASEYAYRRGRVDALDRRDALGESESNRLAVEAAEREMP